jgi:hypothetical protein
MPKFEINKTVICQLIVDCKDSEEARSWADKIVVSIEDEKGDIISSDKFDSFEAETIESEIIINLIE